MTIKKVNKDESQIEDHATASEITPRRVRGREVYLVASGIGAMLLLAAVVVYFWEEVRNLGSYGYLGSFLISILGAGAILVPIPHTPVIFALGGVMPNPALVGMAAGLGEPIGELTGYLTGRGGWIAFQGRWRGIYSRMVNLVEGREVPIVILAAMFPNPFFDLVGATVGALRFPLWKFMLACWVGKTIKGVSIAYAGAWGLGFIIRWLSGL